MQLTSFMAMMEDSNFTDLHQLQQKYSVVKTNELLSCLNKYFYKKTDLKLNSYWLVFMPAFARIDSRLFTLNFINRARNINMAVLFSDIINACQQVPGIIKERHKQIPWEGLHNLLTSFSESSDPSVKLLLQKLINSDNVSLTSKDKQRLAQLLDSALLDMQTDPFEPLIKMTVLLAFVSLSLEDEILSLILAGLIAATFLIGNQFPVNFVHSLFIGNLQQTDFLPIYSKQLKLILQNAKISKLMDIIPLFNFIFTSYQRISIDINSITPTLIRQTDYDKEILPSHVSTALFTEKQMKLWYYVLQHYQNRDFTIQNLEKDFDHAAYATVRSFVLTFVEAGLLKGEKYANKVKYRITSADDNRN